MHWLPIYIIKTTRPYLKQLLNPNKNLHMKLSIASSIRELAKLAIVIFSNSICMQVL